MAISFFILILFSLLVVEPVLAFGKNVVESKETVVEQNQTVDNVVVFGSDAIIKGSVRGAVIVINGDLTIQKSAEIKGLVLAVGGQIDQQPGAKIRDEVLSFNFGHGRDNSFLIGGILLLASWTVALALSLLFVIFSVITGLVLRDNINKFITPIRRSTGKLIIIGAITNVLLTAISLLLFVSIIGIPVAVVLFFLPLVFFFIGLAAVSKIVGQQMTRQEPRPSWLSFLYGSAIVVACINFPFLGWLLFLGLVWLSTGLMAMWVVKKIKTRK